MYITTLEVIHQLLQKEAERTEKAADAARKLLHRYEADDAAHTLIEEQRATANALDEKATRAATALADFQFTSWS